MRDPDDNAQTRARLALWLTAESERLGLDLRLIRFLDDGVEAVVALLPRSLSRPSHWTLFGYANGKYDVGHALIEQSLLMAKHDLEKASRS